MSTTKTVAIAVTAIGTAGALWWLLRPETVAEANTRSWEENRRQNSGVAIFSMPVIVRVGGRFLVVPTAGQ